MITLFSRVTRQVVWKRVVDLNDRALRHIVVGLGGKPNGVPREDGFDISVASEVMGILCLSTSLEDLKARAARMIVAYNYDGEPVTVDDIHATGAVTLLFRSYSSICTWWSIRQYRSWM